VTYKGTNTPRITLYVDGIPKTWGDPGRYTHGAFPSEPLLTPDLANAVLRIGGREAGSGNYTAFNGLVDELQIYNYALETAEVQYLFANPGQIVLPPEVPVIRQHPVSQTVMAGATVTFRVEADARTPLSYQWQFDGANLTGATSAILTLSAVTTNHAGSYSVVASNALGTVTSRAAILTVNVDTTPPTIQQVYSAVTGPLKFQQITVEFSEPVTEASATDVSNYSLSGGLTVSGAKLESPIKVVLTTSQQTSETEYVLTVNKVRDLAFPEGNPIAPDTQVRFVVRVALPLDFGRTVNGFQDDFASASRDANWVSAGAGQDLYEQTQGVLKVPTIGGDPNHLLYVAPDYNASTQEVLARIKINAFSPEAASRAGITVGGSLESAPAGQGINLLFVRDVAGLGIAGTQFRLLDDYRAWGPQVSTLAWKSNAWYWLRLRQEGTSTAAGPNIHAKVWLADGLTPEPVDWQKDWSRDGRSGFAGILGPSGGVTDFEVDYILLKAQGLPEIKVVADEFATVQTINIFQQPKPASVRLGGTATFTVGAIGFNVESLVYQWQKAPPGSDTFADILGANQPSYTTPALPLSESGSRFRCVVSGAGISRVANPVTLIVDIGPPLLLAARTLGNPNQVTVFFSKPIAPGATPANFAIDQGITVNSVAPGRQASTLVLAVSTITAGKDYTLTVNGIYDLVGNQIEPNSQVLIDLSVNWPLDYGQTVNGFQDDFAGAVRDINWLAVPAENDLYVQADGVLKVPTIGGDPNKLLYSAPGYSDATQEVLARLRVKVFSAGGGSRAGVTVGSDPGAAHPGEGINLLFIDFDFGDASGPSQQFRLLDDWRAWGPRVISAGWQTNTWYWLRLRQDSSSTEAGPNIHGKVWPADGSSAEPLDWQVNWSRSGRTGFAGIQGPSGGTTDFEVDYILIKAEGLPSIKVAPNVFALVGPPVTPKLNIIKVAEDVVLTWSGGGLLESTDNINGPWVVVAGASSPHTEKVSGRAKFYRVRK
jgi:hypothetical protein